MLLTAYWTARLEPGSYVARVSAWPTEAKLTLTGGPIDRYK